MKESPRKAQASSKMVRAQRDVARAEATRLTGELTSERAERGALIAEAVHEVQVMLDSARNVNGLERATVASLERSVADRDATSTMLQRQLDDRTRELADTCEDAKNANAHVARLTEELRTNATLVEVRALRKRLQAKTEKCAALERELERLQPTAVKLDVRPRVVGTVKP